MTVEPVSHQSPPERRQTDKAGPARLALLDEAPAQRLRRKYADSTSLLDRYASTAPGSTDGR